MKQRVAIVMVVSGVFACACGGGSGTSADSSDPQQQCLAAMRKVKSPPAAPDLAPTLEVCRTVAEWSGAAQLAGVFLGYGPLPALIDACHQAGSDRPLCAEARTHIPPATTTTTTAPPPPTAPPPTTAPGPVTVFSASGSGSKNTQVFNTPSEWQLQYTFDCSAFGPEGNFIVDAEPASGGYDPRAPRVNDFGPGKSDVTYAHNDAGAKFLRINSECDWSVRVVG